MLLVLQHPGVAGRDCQDCLKHVYNEKTGEREEWPRGSGKGYRRPPGTSAPCRKGACPKVAPEGEPGSKALSAKNWQAYQHYLECEAVGDFPRDPIVRRNAAIIKMARDSVEKTELMAAARTGLASVFSGKLGLGR